MGGDRGDMGTGTACIGAGLGKSWEHPCGLGGPVEGEDTWMGVVG